MSDMTTCRVCGGSLDPTPALDLAPPALTTTNDNMDVPTRFYVCGACAHVQSPALPDLAAYYDVHYKISLDSEEHDQLYEMRASVPIYRTDRQAEVVLEKVALPAGAKVLDYGAAKAQTLQKILARRPDLAGHVFDVSEDYRPFWRRWLSDEATASYELPADWRGRFDLVTAHYVMEHVPDPIGALKSLAGLLAPGGRIFFSVPDWSQNTGDLLVADHINHFTKPSLSRLATEVGLEIDNLDDVALPTAFVVTAHVSAHSMTSDVGVAEAADAARRAARGLVDACGGLERAFVRNAQRRSAIYGAGFYGAFLLTRLRGRAPVACCLDNNRHLWGKTLFGVPVQAPDSLPSDVEVVYVGLNPARAKAIAAGIPVLQRDGLELVFMEV